MFVVGALFGLVTLGFVVPCLIDVAVAPDCEVRGMAKPWWVLALVFFSVLGVVAWLLVGRPRPRRQRRALHWFRLYDARYVSSREAIRRHPAGQAVELGNGPVSGALWADAAPARPVGPDDDPEFLAELARRIHGGEPDYN